MSFKNPLKSISPERGDSMIEMMQGAFWTMIAFMLMSFIAKIFGIVLAVKTCGLNN